MKERRFIAIIISTIAVLASSVGWAASVGKSPYGADDEIGALNMLSPAKSLEILQRIDSGKVYDLGVEYFVGMPTVADMGMGDPAFHMWMTHTPSGFKAEGFGSAALYDDAVIMSTHDGTHIDALNHIGHGDKIYNGLEASKHLGNKGWTKGGASAIPPIIARGVMIDVAGEKGVNMLPDSYGITVEDLKATLDKQNLSLQKGDVVLVRTGRMNVWPNSKKYMPNEPGLTLASAAWLIDQGAMILGADNFAVEKFPMEGVHDYVLAERGVNLLEKVWLEDLAKDGVHEFAFIAAPIKFKGATGSPLRPLALPVRR